jgi:hypothetical protein
MVSKLKNEYFLELLGYCLEDGNRMLAYQFATMGSLHNILHGNKSFPFHYYLMFFLHNGIENHPSHYSTNYSRLLHQITRSECTSK